MDLVLGIVEELRKEYGEVDLTFPYRHIAAVLDENYNVLTSGTNSDRPVSRTGSYTRHAEMDAILKFLDKGLGRSHRKIIIMVFKASKTGVLSISKPCRVCIGYFQWLEENGYVIKYIYYSDRGNVMVRKRPIELYEDPERHTTLQFK